MSPKEYKKEIKAADCLICGYRVFCDHLHPIANSNGWVYLHRHLASLKIDRWLTNKEQVHHIDGNKLNNSLDNLEILSKKEHAHKHFGYRKIYKCKICSKESHNAFYCSQECAHQDQERVRLSKEELFNLVWSAPMKQAGAIHGISDSALIKKCKKFGVKMPPNGYWLSRNSGKTHEEALAQLEINKNYKPLPPKFTREQLISIIEGIKSKNFSLREIGEWVNCGHHPIMNIKNKLNEGKISDIFKYYKAGDVPEDLK
jgi:HNH endonuclease